MLAVPDLKKSIGKMMACQEFLIRQKLKVRNWPKIVRDFDSFVLKSDNSGIGIDFKGKFACSICQKWILENWRKSLILKEKSGVPAGGFMLPLQGDRGAYKPLPQSRRHRAGSEGI